MKLNTMKRKHPYFKFEGYSGSPEWEEQTTHLFNELASKLTEAEDITLNDWQDMEQDTGIINITYPNGVVLVYEPDEEDPEFYEMLYWHNDSCGESSWDFIPEADRTALLAVAKHMGNVRIMPLGDCGDMQYQYAPEK